MRPFFLGALLAGIAGVALCATPASAQSAELDHTLSARVAGTHHGWTGNDRWAALMQVTGTWSVSDEAIIVVEGAASIAERVQETEAGPFGFGVRADFPVETDDTRRTSRIGMYSSFPGDDSGNVALAPLYAYGIDQPWLLGPGFISIMGGGRFEQRHVDVLHFAIEGTAALMISPGYREVTASGVGAVETGLVLGPVSLIGRLSASFGGRAWAVAGSPRLVVDLGQLWVQASVSATFAGTLPAELGGYGMDAGVGMRF